MIFIFLVFFKLSGIQGRTGTKPSYLLFIISVLHFKALFRPVFVMENDSQVASRSEVHQTKHGQKVVFTNFIIIGFVYKSEGKASIPCFFRFVS